MLTRITSSIATVVLLFSLIACSGSETVSNEEITAEDQLTQIKQANKIRIGIRSNSQPFAFIDENGNYVGLEIDVAHYIAKELLGEEKTVQFIPIFDANQKIALLEEDKIDLAIAAIPDTLENQEKIDLSESYYASGIGLLTRKDSQINNWNNLRGQKVCGIRGMPYIATLEDMGMDLIFVRNQGDAHFTLQDRHCIGFVYDNSAIASVLQLPQWSNHWHQPLPVLFSTPWSIGIRKGEAELKKAVNNAIFKMSAEGLIVKNEKKWKIIPTEFVLDRMNFARAMVEPRTISHLKRDRDTLDLANNHILIDGSIVVFPIVNRIAKKFMDIHPKSRIAIGTSGSQQGFEKFCQGVIDIIHTPRPINISEIQSCQENKIEYVELPIAFDSIVLVTSILNDRADCLTPNKLNKIWNRSTEKVTNWQQIDSQYSDLKLTLFGNLPDSNTYEYFTTKIVGKNNQIRDNYLAYQDNKRLIQAIAENKGSLGFVDFSIYTEYADRKKIKSLRIANENNRCIKPNPISIANGTYDLLSRPLFLYIRKTALQENMNVKEFTQYLLTPENSFVISEVGYIPLPQEVLQKVQIRLDNVTTGSIFAGQSSIGVRLLNRL